MAVAAPCLDAARARPPSIPKLVRAAQPLPLTRRAPDLPGGSQRELLPSFISTGMASPLRTSPPYSTGRMILER